MFESGWVDNHYNDCGYRSAHSCKTLPTNTMRIAVLGTSISRGYWVPYDQTFAGRMENDLTATCGKPVDVQNVSQADSILIEPNGATPVWHHIADQVTAALKLQPKALVMVMTPFDIASYQERPTRTVNAVQPPSFSKMLMQFFETTKNSINNDSRAMLVARHIGFEDSGLYIRHAMTEGDRNGYLKQPFDAQWVSRLQIADATIGRIASQAASVEVPFIVVLMPSRAAAMLSPGDVGKYGLFPYAFGDALSKIAQARHAEFIDMTRFIHTLPDPGDLYFEINGHPNDAGHAAIASRIELALKADVPEFTSCK